MSTAPRPMGRRLSAAALALALAAGGTGLATLSFAPSAFAASNVSTIDTSKAVSLKIHKHRGPVGAAGNGDVASPAPTGVGLNGVVFDIYRVDGVDVTTNAGWLAATEIQGHTFTAAEVAAEAFTAGSSYTMTKVTPSVTTATDGTATFSPTGADAMGVYVVVENLGASTSITEANVGAATVDAATLTALPPFVVTLPLTNAAENGWLYDVNVYPKNVSDSITKVVADLGTVAGGTDKAISYTLDSTIPDNIPAGQLGTYVINDNMPDNVSLTGVSLELSGGDPLVAGVDYVLYTGADGQAMVDTWTGATPLTGGPTFSIVFTQDGRDKLQQFSSETVVVKVDATVDAQSTTGVFSNTADLIPSSSWWNDNKGTNTYDPNDPTDANNPVPTTPVGIPSDPVDSKYGDLQITKRDAAAPATTKLAGAIFDVYSAGTDQTCDATDIDSTATVLATSAATAATTGLVTIEGLQSSTFYNGVDHTDPTEVRGYCLVETQAPDGYNLLAEPIYFTITDLGSDTPNLLDVDNQLTNLGNTLPLTGGAGAAAISIGGLLFVGGGLAYYLISSRRRDEAETA